MKSFRTELEDQVVEKDILELEKKIRLHQEGKIDDEKFRSLRLARGVYGQRQPGVQMIRMKLPFGRLTGEQLLRIADVSDKYSTGRLHITTRQDIQIHFVSLDETPQLWADLEKDDVTLREACGNTVRNVTASETAGIDTEEPFDVTPFAEATYRFFLRNPICQEMGRKFKVAFSSSDADTALTYMHDLGFIPKIKLENGKEIKGFKVLIGGGLGSQPRHADVVYEFLSGDQIIPFMEGVLRVFDRHGERSRRLKARLKFLFNDIGKDAFLALVAEEQKALSLHTYPVDDVEFQAATSHVDQNISGHSIQDKNAYAIWKDTNVIAQKQEGLFAIGIRVPLGDFYTDKARLLAQLVKNHGGNELRLTIRQNILLRNISEAHLPFFYLELDKLGFALPGYNSFNDITACPGTDTCNLGISNSTGIAKELERVLTEEYPHYLRNSELAIKISGCMNSCGQHMMAHIGFQGMTINAGKLVAPALQVLLGGGTIGNGEGRFAKKIIKIPSKRGPNALRQILNDFETNNHGDSFLAYYDRVGEKYFYDLLKPLADSTQLLEDEYIDWGHTETFKKEIGVGECAGVIIDLVATLFFETEEKIDNAKQSLTLGVWADSIYHAYSSMINTAKAVLLTKDKQTNTQVDVVHLFDEVFGADPAFQGVGKFSDLVFAINANEPTQQFATEYLQTAEKFYQTVSAYRNAI